MKNAKTQKHIFRICLIAVIAIMLSVTLVTAFGTEETGKIRIRYPDSYGTYSSFSDIVSTLGIEGSMKPESCGEYRYLYQGLQNENVDICFPLVMHAENETDIIYTDYKAEIKIVAVYKQAYSKDTTFKKIAVVENSIVDEYARITWPAAEIVTVKSVGECLEAVSSGKATCALLTGEQVAVYLTNNKDYAALKTITVTQDGSRCIVALAVKDPEMAEKINAAVASMDNGAVDARIQKYLNTQDAQKELPVALIVLLSVIVALLVLGYIMIKRYRAHRKEQMAVINGLSSDFECVTLLDVKSNHETRYRVSELFSRHVTGWQETEDYGLRMRMFAENLVVEEDRKRFITESEKERVAQRLKENGIYVVNYRINVDGKVLYFQTKYVNDKLSKNCVIAGFHSVDAETRKELELQKKIQENAMVQRLSLQMVTTLVKIIDAKDKYTNGHSIRVATYAREIARRSGLSEEKQQEIYYMGLLHDIGKIGIPDEVINKTGRLTDEEFAIIKEHPATGADILGSITEMPKLRIGALQHHEHYDGTGYPEGLAGKKIAQEARILGVADAYDAMSSPRSFRDAYSQEKIKDEFKKGIGTQFDPEYAAFMLDMIEEDKNYEMREQYGLQ